MDTGTAYTVERVSPDEYGKQLSAVFASAGVTQDELCGLGDADLLRIPAGITFHTPDDGTRAFWVLLEGEVLTEKVDPDGSRSRLFLAKAGDSFGEVVLLIRKVPYVYMTALQPSVGLRFDEDTFWRLMACSTSARTMILTNMATRLNAHIAEAAHREKLISLGTLAAGLMHELHNPGSAAKRAASQLRANLLRLQDLSLRFCDRDNTPEQLACMRDLQRDAITHARATAMSSLEQADAEEAMADWLDSSGVENAYQIAPTLVGIGLDTRELECTRAAFGGSGLSDALNWLESLISSVSLVDAIEQSITRVSDLVMAVKKFAYDDRCTMREVDVHDSIQSTLTILGHKLRQQQINVVKHFDAEQPNLRTTGVAISQIWTNLIDNAIDASPEGGTIDVHTWSEPGYLVVSVTDQGSGIPEELKTKIFDPFFTTKPVGKGTGLGLEIVHRLVTQGFSGKIDVDSKPGSTRFVVRLPHATA